MTTEPADANTRDERRHLNHSTPIILGIVAVAAALRLYGIWFGLPFLEARPDEETAIGHAAAVLGGQLNPHFFHWPSLTFYLFALLFAGARLIQRVLSLGVELTIWDQIRIARVFVALAGTGTVWLLYRLGREFADATTGLIAATLFAVAILHVRESHFAMTDALMTVFVVSSLTLILRAVNSRTHLPQPFAAAGLLGGLAASTKYSAAAVVVAMGAAQLVLLASTGVRPTRIRTWVPSMAFVAAFAVSFFAGTPFAALDFPEFLAGLQQDAAHLSAGHGVMLGRGWTYHIVASLPYGVGVPIFVAALAGVVVVTASRRLRRHGFILGSFAAAFYVSVGSGYTVFMRYVLPLVPLTCLAAAVAIRQIATRTARFRSERSATAITLLATVVVGIVPAANCVWFDVLLARTDTRVLATRWLENRLTANDTVYEAGSIYTNPDLQFLPAHRWAYDAAAQSFGDPSGAIPGWLIISESPLSTYDAVKPGVRELARDKYVIAQVVRATSGGSTQAPRDAVYDPQDAFFLPITGFNGILRPGPTIVIYRLARAGL